MKKRLVFKLNYINRNLESLKKYYPNLLPVIKQLNEISESYQTQHSKNGSPNLIQIINGQAIPMYSLYNPENEVATWSKQLSSEFKAAEHILVNGFGLGYHVEALVTNHPDKKFYICEPDISVFTVAMHVRDLSRLLKHRNLKIIAIGSDEVIIQQFIDEVVNQLTGSLEVINIPFYEKIYKNIILEIEKHLIDTVKGKRTNLVTFQIYSIEWMKNIFNNLKYIKKSYSVDFLKGRYPSTPAIIVGSGPSLSYDIDLLKQLKHKAIIIAAGSSTQALLAANLEPDIIVSMDGGEANYKAFHLLDTHNIPFIFAPILYRGILNEKHNFISYALLNLDPITPRLLGNTEKQTVFSSHYSVTGLCIQLACFMGCPKVIFTGQDLSFPSGQYYHTNIDHEDKLLTDARLKQADTVVPNVSGGTNPINHVMYVTLKDIEKLLERFEGIDFINSSRNGAEIQGAKFIPLELLQLDTLCKRKDDEIKSLFVFSPDENNKEQEVIDLKIKSDFREINQLKRVVSSVVKHFKSLEGRALSSKEKKDNSDIITGTWDKIANNQMFHIYVGYGLNSILYAKGRYIKEIQNILDVSEKFDMIVQHIGPLTQIIDRYLEELIDTMSLTIEDICQDNK